MRTVTAVSGQEAFHVRLSTEKHIWAADEPLEKGGHDIGPNPFELLAGAIGSCVVITAQMYAHRKEWPLESVKVRVDHKHVSAEECDDCESASGKVSLFTLDLALSGDSLTPEQRERILEIAMRCPVKRAIQGEVVFRQNLDAQ